MSLSNRRLTKQNFEFSHSSKYMDTQIFLINPKLRGLLLILIFTFVASGIALALLAQIQAYHREQIYLATEAALPAHKAAKSENQKIGKSDMDMSNWKTYRNEKYGFELQYPKTWKVKEDADPNNSDYKTISFETVTKDPVWLKNGSNTAPVFQAEIYTAKQYSDSEKWCKDMQKNGSDPSFCYRLVNILGRNSKYVFVYYSPAGPGLNPSPIDFNYSLYQIGEASAETFRFIK